MDLVGNFFGPQIPLPQLYAIPFPGYCPIADTGSVICQLQQVILMGFLLFNRLNKPVSPRRLEVSPQISGQFWAKPLAAGTG